MMYSGKPPPLKLFANNDLTATASSKDASSGVGITQPQLRGGKSENCDPNLLVRRAKDALRKAESSPVLGDNNRDDSGNGIGSILQLPKQPDQTGASHLECDASGALERQSKENSRVAGKSFIPSPAQVSAAQLKNVAAGELEWQSKEANQTASKSASPSPTKARMSEHPECDSNGQLERQPKVGNQPARKSSLRSPTKARAGAAQPEDDAAGELDKQSVVNRLATSKLLQSPSPSPASHQHGHGHSPRPHFCRSPYCASNNPDYATKPQVPPRKYLISKRHLVPGAICTKDPAVLASQAVLHVPSTGKPPKPSRKVENGVRQPSFTTKVSERSAPPLSYEYSPSRIPKPPSSCSPGVHESTPLLDQRSCAVPRLTVPAVETHSPSTPAVSQNPASKIYLEGRLPETNVAESDNSSSLASDSSCTIAVTPTSPRSSDDGESSQASVAGTPLTASSVTSAGETGLESPIPSIPTEGALSFQQPSPDPSLSELEILTQSLARTHVFETAEECHPTEDILSPDGADGRTEFEENAGIAGDQDADDHTSSSDSEFRVLEENRDGGARTTESFEAQTEFEAHSSNFFDQDAEEPPTNSDSELRVPGMDEDGGASRTECREGRTESEEDSSISCKQDAEEQVFNSHSKFLVPEEIGNGEACRTEGLEGRTESDDESNMSLDRDAEGHTSNSDSELLVPDENGDGETCQTEGLEGRTESEEDSRNSLGRDAEEHNSDNELLVPNANGNEGDCPAENISGGEDYQAEDNLVGGEVRGTQNAVERNYASREAFDGEDFQFRSDVPIFDETPSSDGIEGQSVPEVSCIEELESSQSMLTAEGQREVPKYVRGKGRQLWRSDCRDSREVVFLKQTPQTDRRPEGDWMVNDILEGAISRLNSSGKGRVRVLVEAFESMMNLGGDTDSSNRRASRVWCLNRMKKGEVDEDGEEFEDGDQRVDCYEVSGDGLQLRASMRLSLGGGNLLRSYNPDEDDEIELSAIQKVQEWDDHCRQSQSQSLEDQDCGHLRSSESQSDGVVVHDQETLSEGRSESAEVTFGNLQRRISFSENHTVLGEDNSLRSSEDFSCDARTENQFGCHNSDGGQRRTDERSEKSERSTFSLDLDREYKTYRRRWYWNTRTAKLEHKEAYDGGGSEKDRATRGTTTVLEPFHLYTEERGMMKEHQFSQKLQQMFEEENRLRHPIAQGLPWTTDFPEVVPKPPVKEQTRPVEFRHYSNSRAIERAEYDTYISERNAYLDMQREEEERLRLAAEEEEIKRMRREMVPKAQLMPFFDQPFIPTRSSKRLTVPKEPTFLNRQHKRPKCIVWQQQQQQYQHLLTQTYQ